MPGPASLRIRVAFSGVAAQGEGLKPYQYVPIAFVATMAARAATGTPQRAFIVSRNRGNGQRHGRVAGDESPGGDRRAPGQVAGQQVITLDTVKPLLDDLAAGAFPELEKYVKPK